MLKPFLCIAAAMLTLAALAKGQEVSVQLNGQHWELSLPTEEFKGYVLEHKYALDGVWQQGNQHRGDGNAFINELAAAADSPVFLRYRVFDVWNEAHIEVGDQQIIDQFIASSPEYEDFLMTVTAQNTGTLFGTDTQVRFINGIPYTMTVSVWGIWSYETSATNLNQSKITILITQIDVNIHYVSFQSMTAHQFYQTYQANLPYITEFIDTATGPDSG